MEVKYKNLSEVNRCLYNNDDLLTTDCRLPLVRRLSDHYPASLGMTCGQHVEFPNFFTFLDRNYDHKLVATQIPQNYGLPLMPYSGRKFFHNWKRTSDASQSMNSKNHMLNRVKTEYLY